ncbi:MAG: Protein OS-9 [Caeruleum heppii]|nr:MAG: Protein OS-9 [Caeruleum heppii]
MRADARLLLLLASAAQASQHVFSVYDDVLAFPQYEVIFSETFITDTEAESLLIKDTTESTTASRQSPTKQQEPSHPPEHATELSNILNQAEYHQPPTDDSFHDDQVKTYESMFLHGKRYLCAIPVVEKSVRNETAEASAKLEAEKELTRATTRGWELLQGMEGDCLYYMSGWWSYQFCYNGKVKQFHPLPPQQGVPFYPPREDPTTPAYILGQVKAPKEGDEQSARGEIAAGRSGAESTELQAKGEMRYLVQRLGAGTVCDLTGRERKIEIQVATLFYHSSMSNDNQFQCNPQGPDKIGWIKEVTTCSYVMVVYTPRLCDDVAFLPPRESRANPIACREVIRAADIPVWKARKAGEIERKLLEGAVPADEETAPPHRPRYPIIGGVEVGAQKEVGGDGGRIEGGAIVGGNGGVHVVARSEGKSKGGKVEKLSDEQLRKINLDPEVVAVWREQLMDQARERGWRLEIVHTVGGEREMRGLVHADDDDEKEDGRGGEGGTEGIKEEEEDGEEQGEGEGDEEAEEESYEGAEGSEETYQEEL